MKKIFTSLSLVLCMLCCSPFLYAQEAYQMGDRIISGGISLSNYNYNYAGNRVGGFIPVFGTLEFGVHKYISVGPYVGFANYKYTYSGFRRDNYYYNYNYNHFSLGARASFHYVPLLNEHLDFNLDTEKLDFYFSVQAGLAFSSSSFRSNDPDVTPEFYNNARGNTQYPTFGPLFGFRYMFTNKFGAYLEAGRGAFGYASIGLSGKF